MKVVHVAGARPNFMKLAPVMRALRARGVETPFVHTGQHYDPGLSGTFIEQLDLPEPVFLGVGSGSHAVQTARAMEGLEPFIVSEHPDLVLVVGDVNSTLAAALVCAKLMVPVAHVEAGLRSFDRTMPEEINRVLTDQISELLLTTSPEAEGNLVREGVDVERIHFVGNPMIDSLEWHRAQADASDVLSRLGLEPRHYALVTLHRPSNVDDADSLAGILNALNDVAREVPVLFPAHPRTLAMIAKFGLEDRVTTSGEASGNSGRITCIEPVAYLDFVRLMSEASVVITDSGGVQEETTVLGIPCLTVRPNTERPITIEMGTNQLVGVEPDAIRAAALEALSAPPAEPRRPPLWDGRAGERIADVIVAWRD
jgi:UDP-N-acetylglucosamine 2-epimerase (non-hydrolysing)